MIYQISIPYQPYSLNDYTRVERSNKFAAAGMKKKYEIQIAYMVKALKLQPLPLKQYDILVHHQLLDNRTDSDNIHYGIKPVLDGLVKAGILANDNPKNVRNILHLRSKAENYSMELYFVPANQNPGLINLLLATLEGDHER